MLRFMSEMVRPADGFLVRYSRLFCMAFSMACRECRPAVTDIQLGLEPVVPVAEGQEQADGGQHGLGDGAG